MSDIQARRLRSFGAEGAVIDELRGYFDSAFELASAEDMTVPLADELFVDIWRRWADEARSEGAFNVLRRYLPQLRFPIAEGISQSEAYRAATLRGVDVDQLPEASGLELAHPEAIELQIYQSFAGRIPVLIARRRDELVVLIQALSKKNEPVPVSPSQGAAMVAGLNNWQRIKELRQAFENRPDDDRPGMTWGEEFARIREHRELYQDRFMLLGDGPYSAVQAADLGLEDATWRELSLIIRREHECTHYFTRRLFGSMRNNLHDELIADYTGLVAATGEFRAAWFLRFVGLEDFPRYRPGARLEIYRGKPPLSDAAFAVLQAVVRAAAINLERFDRAFWPSGPRRLEDRARMIRALASLRLDELADEDAGERLARALGPAG